eukprot:607687-Alexandrium_andersonii.AAC.1
MAPAGPRGQLRVAQSDHLDLRTAECQEASREVTEDPECLRQIVLVRVRALGSHRNELRRHVDGRP